MAMEGGNGNGKGVRFFYCARRGGKGESEMGFLRCVSRKEDEEETAAAAAAVQSIFAIENSDSSFFHTQTCVFPPP